MTETNITEVLDNEVLDTTVETTLDDGTHLAETVSLSLRDFALQSVQALAYWEEIDPDSYQQFIDGEITVGSFANSAVKLRGFLYSVIKSKVRDSRIRAGMDVGDFDVAASELVAAVGAIDDLNI